MRAPRRARRRRGKPLTTVALSQTELKMVEINKDPSKIPSWLRANKPMFPDFVTVDPKVRVPPCASLCARVAAGRGFKHP